MKCLIAGLVTELEPKYEDTKKLAESFRCDESLPADIALKVSDRELSGLVSRAAEGTTVGQLENFALGNDFNRKAIGFGTMLVHSSALICDGGAFLFSGASGVGKSFHTRLWCDAFGDAVHIMNDDKPVVKLGDDGAVVYGTPFDGGSGIALNEAFPLRAVIFVERGEENSLRIPDNKEIIQKLYFQTAHMVNEKTAEKMLCNIEKLISLTKFFVMTCNTDISAAYTAHDFLLRNA